MKGKHLVFYDGVCGFCDMAVQFILRHDRCSLFLFAPLQGETAKEVLQGVPSHLKNADSIILVENYQEKGQTLSIMGKAVFRICWLLGGLFAIPGLLSFLPAGLYDFGYRFVAKRRHRLFKNTTCVIPSKEEKERYLP